MDSDRRVSSGMGSWVVCSCQGGLSDRCLDGSVAEGNRRGKGGIQGGIRIRDGPGGLRGRGRSHDGLHGMGRSHDGHHWRGSQNIFWRESRVQH